MAEIKKKEPENKSTNSKTEDEKIQKMKKAVNAMVIKNDVKSSSKKISPSNPVSQEVNKNISNKSFRSEKRFSRKPSKSRASIPSTKSVANHPPTLTLHPFLSR